MDKEFTVLDIIDKYENITQREISKKSDLSLGSVNLLLNKMVRDGLIKVRQIPVNRVAYMLTPKGMAEKVTKTYNYIKSHYHYINETKEKMKESLCELKNKGASIAILLDSDEISELLKAAAVEVGGIEIVNDIAGVNSDSIIITVSNDTLNVLNEKGFTAINLIETI